MLKKRLAQRKKDVSDATEQLTDKQSEQLQPPTNNEEAYCISLDTEDKVAVASVLEQLSAI